MKNIFIPSDTLTYLGTYEALANLLYGLNGELKNDGKYHCKISFPGRKWNRGVSFVWIRGKMSFIFRGDVVSCGDAYRVTYKVYPSFSSSLLLLFLAYLVVDLFTSIDGEWQHIMESLLRGGIMSALLIGLFLLTRYFAIRRFIKYIGENEKENTGIFD